MSTRARRFLIALAIAGGILAALYAAAPAIFATIAVRVLGDVVEVTSLEIESIGPSEVDVARIGVDNSQMRLAAQHAVIRYRLWPFQIRDVDIKQVQVVLKSASTGPPGAAPVPAALPALPLFPLHVDSLDIRGATPWGDVHVPLSLESGPGSAGGLRAEIRGPDFSARVDNPGRDRQTVTLVDAHGVSLLEVNAVLDGHYPVHFDGSLDPGSVLAWIRAGTTMPAGIKSALDPFEAANGGIHFDGSVQQNMDLSARMTGELVVRDRRNASTRLFQRVDFKSSGGYGVSRTGSSWSGSGNGGLEVALNPQTTFKGRDPEWSWDNAKGLTFNAANPSLEQLGLEADAVTASVPSLTAVTARGDISAEGLRTSGWPTGFSHYDLDGNWSWDGTSLKAGGSGKGPGLPALSWKLQTAGGRGQVEISGHDAVAALAPSLKVYTQSVARDLKVKSGEVDGRYRFQWSTKGEQTGLALTAGPVDADLDEMEIRGMEARLANQGDTIDNLTLLLSVPSLKLGAGVEAEHAELNLRLALPQVHIETASLHLFGGEISIRPTSFNLNDDSFELVADVSAVSLEKLMKFFDLKSTELTGAVTGPVRVIYNKDGGLEINEGDLHSVQPGVLKFTMGPDSAAASQLNNIALQALKDFQYKELKASLVYKPDGEYRIAARIVGSNPNVLNGHPIALNPTIQGRLPALFRAFFITGDFDKAIIETLQKENSSSTSGETPSLNGD